MKKEIIKKYGKTQISIWVDTGLHEEIKKSCNDRNRMAGHLKTTLSSEYEKAMKSRMAKLRRI